jgi:hypothetical protein
MALTDRSDLSPQAVERISSVIRGLTEDNVDRGIDLTRPMRCDSCDCERSPAGASQYGAYALCNECLLEFTLALAKGDIENVAEYMTKRPETSATDSYDDVEHSSAVYDTRPVRAPFGARSEKLRPSNEPC